MPIVKTGILLAAMTALFGAVGYLIGGQGGMLIAFLIAAGMNVWSWWSSDKMVLRMHNAKLVTRRSAPELVGLVEELAKNAGLPAPAVYLIETDQPNAFATGRSPENAAVAATTGLLRRLSREELAGVMAHELAHIKHRDTLLMTVTATIAGTIGMLTNFAFFFRGNRDNPLGFVGVLLAVFLAPLAAGLVQMAISRTREYEADREGAEICGRPLWLAAALAKIHDHAARIDNERAEAHPATAHMFIVNPLHAHARDALFATHPDVRNRIARLEAMAGGRRTPAPSRNPARASGPWG